jgi:hypothetical protein
MIGYRIHSCCVFGLFVLMYTDHLILLLLERFVFQFCAKEEEHAIYFSFYVLITWQMSRENPEKRLYCCLEQKNMKTSKYMTETPNLVCDDRI